MAVCLTLNSQPETILSNLKKKIDEKIIEGWEYDTDGDFTLSDTKWNNKAWFTPSVLGSFLNFGLLGRKGVMMTKQEYSVYHGRFSEMLLEHFTDDISFISIMPPFKSSIDTKDIEK